VSVYKEISFFEQVAGSGFLKNVLFSGRTGTLTCKQAFKNQLFHEGVFPPD
jgi:hypothetical protein